MQRTLLPIVLAIVFLIIMVFYLVPGVSHPLVTEQPTAMHVKHALVFGGLAVLSLIWARFAANASR